jgi:hypothetical protein
MYFLISTDERYERSHGTQCRGDRDLARFMGATRRSLVNTEGPGGFLFQNPSGMYLREN